MVALARCHYLFVILFIRYNLQYMNSFIQPSSIALSRGVSIEFQVGIRTRVCHTSGRRATIWATPHPIWATPLPAELHCNHMIYPAPYLSYTAPSWAMPQPTIWATAHPNWATFWASLHPCFNRYSFRQLAKHDNVKIIQNQSHYCILYLPFDTKFLLKH